MPEAEIINLVILWIVFVISIWFHEYAHAYVSDVLWDPTPKLQWRLTPNPIKHLDPMGFIMIFLIHFGRWKPVITNPTYYKKPLRDELLVALAWPFANFFMAFLWSFLIVLIGNFGQSNFLIGAFFTQFILINIVLWVFNLLPIYPLDGYRIIKFLKPNRARFMEENALTFTIIFLFMVLVFRDVLWKIIFAIAMPIFDLFLFIANFII